MNCGASLSSLYSAGINVTNQSDKEETIPMTTTITTGAVHHISLTVSNVARAETFYTTLLGFQRIGWMITGTIR